MAAQHILPSTPVAFHSAGWSQLTHVGLNCVRPCARAHIRSAVASSSMGSFESVRNQVAAEAKNGGWLGCAHKLLAESVPLEGPLRADARKNAH